MKKTIRNLLMGLMVLWGVSASATSTKVPASTETNYKAVKATILLNRLERINEIDKSSFTHNEKKAMRKEVKSIQKELKQLDRGVYMSVGAVIIILLLLILLL